MPAQLSILYLHHQNTNQMFRRTKRCFLFYLVLQYSPLIFAQEKPQLTLNQTWSKALEFSREININNLEVHASKEEISESKRERFPEISLKGNYEYATNIPVNEKRLLNKTTKQEIIHMLYKMSTEYYINM